MVGQKIRNPLCPFNFKRVVEVFLFALFWLFAFICTRSLYLASWNIIGFCFILFFFVLSCWFVYALYFVFCLYLYRKPFLATSIDVGHILKSHRQYLNILYLNLYKINLIWLGYSHIREPTDCDKCSVLLLTIFEFRQVNGCLYLL